MARIEAPDNSSSHEHPVVEGERIAVIAGGGSFPSEVAEGIVAQGLTPVIAAVEGEMDDSSLSIRFEWFPIGLGELGRFVPELKRRRISQLVMAGTIKRRPSSKEVRFTPRMLLALPWLIPAAFSGDNVLLSFLTRYFESAGIKVRGPQEFVANSVATRGSMTRAKPQKSDWRDVEAAAEAARVIGRLDIGQAAVSVGGRVIALEGIEGTDGLLERVASLRNHGRVASAGRGVLVKCMKPQQETRADLPSIGPATVEDAHAAGLAGIAVDAGRSFVLERAVTIARADELGLFIYGLSAEDRT